MSARVRAIASGHPDREHGVLTVSASDVVTPTGKLQFAYRVGEGALSSFGPARVVDLEAVEAAGGLEVQVRDEAGNVGQAFWRVPKIAERPEPGVSGAPAETGGAGCSAGGGALGIWALVAGAGCLWRRRRFRR